MPNFDFNGKVALVTGAASGFGLATARAFAEAGAAVALADINKEGVERAAAEIASDGHSARGYAFDVTDEASVETLVSVVVRDFGRLDCAYNNVGIHAPGNSAAYIHEMEAAAFDRVIAVNLRGVWNCTKHEVRAMLAQETGGAIVNCSSQSGIVGTAGLCAYTASKHGVIGLTKCVALEYANKGIRVNAICPGTSDTPMVAKAIENAPEHMARLIADIPVQRLGKPEEIASAVLWLCSPGAGFVIGQAISADGGFTVK
ncbi:MAG: glucose 1-dehydrogenase [Kiritimatiellae bacterium]|nr:glucose 1-dehydrogenase [Kiritimatiellia bacterium]